MLTHVGVFPVDFSRIDTGKTVCFLVSGGLLGGLFAEADIALCYEYIGNHSFPAGRQRFIIGHNKRIWATDHFSASRRM